MKVNIQKFQGGGFTTFTPIIRNAPVQPPSTQSSTKDESKKESNSILDDTTFKELMQKGGLNNEVNALVGQLIELENSSNSLYAYTDPSTRMSSLRLISEVNQLRNNKQNWEDSMNMAKESGGLDEVAVKGSALYIKDSSGKVGTINVADYKKYANKVKVLTVSELMNERQNNPMLIGRNDLFDVANTSIGLEKITDNIKDLISSLSLETTKDEKIYARSKFQSDLEALTGVKPSAEQAYAMEQLKEVLANPSEYYKVTTETKSKRKYLDTAYNYLWKAIGANGQHKLTAISAINGENNPKKYIEDLLLSQTTPSSDTSILPVDESGSTKSKSEAAGEKNLTQFQLFHKDKLMTPNLTFALNDPKFGTMFRGTIGGVSPIITPDGTNVGMTTIGNILNTGYNQILKGNNIYYGNKKVSTLEANNLIYDGQDAAKVYMPTKSDGSPDYESFGVFKEIYTVFEANKDSWSQKQAEDHFKKNGYNIKIDTKYEDGKQIKVIRDNAYVKPFLLMYAYTNDATSLTDGNEEWLSKLTSEEEDLMVPFLDQVWTVGKGKTAQNVTPSKFWNIEEYYKGIVAIPYRDESAAIVDAMVHQGPRERTSSILDVQRNLNYSSNQPLNSNSSSVSLINK